MTVEATVTSCTPSMLTRGSSVSSSIRCIKNGLNTWRHVSSERSQRGTALLIAAGDLETGVLTLENDATGVVIYDGLTPTIGVIDARESIVLVTAGHQTDAQSKSRLRNLNHLKNSQTRTDWQ